MLTIHAASALRRTLDAEPAEGEAVAVRADRIAAIGPLPELLERYPGARVRHWPGTLGPALLHDAPLPPAPTPRERVHALLRLGAAAVCSRHLADPDLREAARRSGVVVLDAPRACALTESGRADLAVFDERGVCVAAVVAGRVLYRRA